MVTGDNFKVEVRSRGKEHFSAAITLVFANAPGGKATHYISPIPERPCDDCYGGGNCSLCKDIIPSRPGIALFWHPDKIGVVKSTELPFPLSATAAIEFLWEYLQTVEYPEQPDHDGSNEKGFLVSTGNLLGHVEGSHYAFVGVYPDWQWYGK